MKNSALSLRLEQELATKLEWLATTFRVPEAQVIRWAIEALHDYTQAHGGRCMMPINFNQLFQLLNEKAQPSKNSNIIPLPASPPMMQNLVAEGTSGNPLPLEGDGPKTFKAAVKRARSAAKED